MTAAIAIQAAYKLHEIWVSAADIREGKGFDLNRIHQSLLQEHRWNRIYPARVSRANAAETKGALVLLGKIRKALS